MNGDEKGEAHRPRPLSAGIWTLFSWLRRSDRSSSSESVSSVGSARTAVSFDFLAPGNYNFANPPIVLTTPLNPPSETYKKRLQERNLRRQRDRNVTLHRKYGLFREYGNGYDGFTLPPARRTLGNSLDRSDRDRRANSESLQRRAAYVPGKRRAPLPPALVTSTSLPRNYKRKRPAPKPPTKNTYKDKNIVQPIVNPVRMTSNCESGAKFVPDGEIANSNKTQKCDKQGTTSKETKPRTDKNFLKHIFENKKRSSVIETSSVRLLPSISELDKQATEIIEKNKLRKKNYNIRHDDITNSENATALYEGNSWFCTSCLRKYNSSVHSCNYCLHEKRLSLQSNDLKIPSPKSSIHTQTNVNVETATSSIEERKILKDILKEMKDSLPKRNKDNKVNNVLTEIPTLRIGSTVQDTYKDFTTQPSSSSQIIYNKNKILPISSLLSETHRNYNKQNDTDQPLLSGANVQSSSMKDTDRENAKPLPVFISSKKKKNNSEQIKNITLTQGKNVDNTDLEDIDKIKNSSRTQSQLLLLSNKADDQKETNRNNLQLSPKTTHNILLGHRQSSYILKNKIDESKVDNGQNQGSSTSTASNVSTASDIVIPKPSKLNFLDFPNSRAVVINTVTVVTTHKNTENNSIQTSTTSAQTGSKIPGIQLQLPFKNNLNPVKNVETTNYQTNLENMADVIKSPITAIDKSKSDHNLHTPLNISSLLNPVQRPNTTIIKEIKSSENNASRTFVNKLPSSSITENKTIEIDNQKLNKEVLKEVPPFRSDLNETCLNKDLTEPQVKEIVKIQTLVKNVSEKGDIKEQKAIASTSGCVSSVKNSNNNIDNLDQYDRRRHLINQLEQSIANGDEVAAAEAAAKLAKLRLSCSVLSFSSQIVGEASNTKQIERKEKSNFLNTKITSPKDKPLKQDIPQAQTAQEVEQVDTNLQKQKSEPDKKLLNNVSVKDVLKLSKESNAKPQQSTSDPSPSSRGTSEDIVPINVWIEDKQAARGPMRLNISRLGTVADLRRQAERSLGLATQLQRWIVGRTLCSDDASSIVSLAGPNLTAPFYLCIVQPDENDQPNSNPVTNEVVNNNHNASIKSGEFYTELMNLEKQSLVPNVEPFECGVCMEECVVGAGVILRECIHTFCRECLSDVVQHSQEPVVACPAMGCSGFLQEREIRTIVTPEEHERWLARSLATAECGTRNAFHCRTRDCTGWAFCDPGVRRFPCPVCKNTNCVQCKAIHEGETCTEYQNKLRQAVTAAETNKDDEGTQALLDSLISRGEALECPECRAIITKKWGCDWVKCSACKTEICWVTKGRRWGPGGRGDTSGGCRCGVDGQRCHPSCGYCH